VNVPATTANLGPGGLNCLGAALPWNNRFVLRCIRRRMASGFDAADDGSEAPTCAGDLTTSSTVLPAVVWKRPARSRWRWKRGCGWPVPPARAWAAAGHGDRGRLDGAKMPWWESVEQGKAAGVLAIDIEGHPDNVVPVVAGGSCLNRQRQPQSLAGGALRMEWKAVPSG